MLLIALIILATVFVVFWLIPKLKRNVAAARRAEEEYAAAQRGKRRQAEQCERDWVRNGPSAPVRSAAPFAHTVSASVPVTRTDPTAEPPGPLWYTPQGIFGLVPDACAAQSNSADTSSSSDSGCSSDSGSSSSDSSS